MLRAPRGARLGYEAWEHTAIGDAHGGDEVTVTTTNGVELTYGQIVALSGDFYRSPEALMSAPADELNALKAIMADEAAAAAASPEGRPSEEQLAGFTERYELATSARGSRASFHRHDTLEAFASTGHGDHEDHGGHDEGGHEGDGGVGGHDDHEAHELVESAGRDAAHAAPAPDASFLELAARNASHFSPENIRNNYGPGHRLALDLAEQAWQLRNPEAEATGSTDGDAPSAREGSLPDTAGVPAAESPRTGPRAPTTTAVSVDESSEDPAEQLEARAWLTDGWANHYLTDAFASGHLVSGNAGREAAELFFSMKFEAVSQSLADAMVADGALPSLGAKTASDALLLGLWELDKLPSMALKLIHDALNTQGIWVKDARGVEWLTLGDKQLARSTATQAQAEEASAISRASIEDVLRTGSTDQAMRALDLIPDVARLPGGDYRPVEGFATDLSTFLDFYSKAMAPAAVGDNQLYPMIRGNIGLLGTLVEQAWIRNVEPVAEEYSDDPDIGWMAREYADLRTWGPIAYRHVRDETALGQTVAEHGPSVLEGAGQLVDWLGDTDVARAATELGSRAGEAVKSLAETDVGRSALAGLADAHEAAVEWTSEEVIPDFMTGLGLLRRMWGAHAASGPDAAASEEVAVTPLENQTYMHGGGMGAAGSMMRDPEWRWILGHLMPETYEHVEGIAELPALMSALENNPVLAAYGTIRHLGEVAGPPMSGSQPAPVARLEWDVWIDDDHPADLDRVRISHGDMLSTVGEAAVESEVGEWLDQHVGVLDGSELIRRRDDIAGGPSASGWMRVYARALALGRGEITEEDSGRGAGVPNVLQSPGGVFLDVKSRSSTVDHVAAFVAALEATGVNVIGVGTFEYGQVDGLDDALAAQGGEGQPGRRAPNVPLQVKFVHGLLHLRQGLQDGVIHPGDQVMFNADAIVQWPDEHEHPMLEPQAMSTFESLASKLGIQFGLYVQETRVDPQVVDLLNRTVNDRGDLFPLGFAYGHLAGTAESTTEGTGSGKQMGLMLEGIYTDVR